MLLTQLLNFRPSMSKCISAVDDWMTPNKRNVFIAWTKMDCFVLVLPNVTCLAFLYSYQFPRFVICVYLTIDWFNVDIGISYCQHSAILLLLPEATSIGIKMLPMPLCVRLFYHAWTNAIKISVFSLFAKFANPYSQYWVQLIAFFSFSSSYASSYRLNVFQITLLITFPSWSPI